LRKKRPKKRGGKQKPRKGGTHTKAKKRKGWHKWGEKEGGAAIGGDKCTPKKEPGGRGKSSTN